MSRSNDSLALLPSAEDGETPRQRRRAPRRVGHRAQLTVPAEMWSEITQIARAAGTTPNDALVRLASERLDDQRRALAIRKRADERWEAFLTAPTADSPAADAARDAGLSEEEPLSEAELLALSRAFREDA